MLLLSMLLLSCAVAHLQALQRAVGPAVVDRDADGGRKLDGDARLLCMPHDIAPISIASVSSGQELKNSDADILIVRMPKVLKHACDAAGRRSSRDSMHHCLHWLQGSSGSRTPLRAYAEIPAARWLRRCVRDRQSAHTRCHV